MTNKQVGLLVAIIIVAAILWYFLKPATATTAPATNTAPSTPTPRYIYSNSGNLTPADGTPCQLSIPTTLPTGRYNTNTQGVYSNGVCARVGDACALDPLSPALNQGIVQSDGSCRPNTILQP